MIRRGPWPGARCGPGGRADREDRPRPADAISLRFQDRRARIFIESLEGSPLPPESPAAELADAGEPAAEFHVGIVRALGIGVPADRAASIDWFRRSAARGYGLGMLALGMALAGPGIVEDEARVVGEPRLRDDLTDLAQSCYWLRCAARVADPRVAGQARFVFEAEVAPRMRPEETRGCKTLLQQSREATP